MRFIPLLLLSALPQALAAQTFFHNVRVFDGDRALPNRDVLVQAGKIVRVGAGLTAPSNATVIDGSGKTLLPGLIDAHTHAWGSALTTALAFGVTTELDMFGDTGTARAWRAEQRAGHATSRADLLSAGTLVTVKGGHGTEYGSAIPTLTSAECAQAFVDARIAEGSDYIKIVYDDGRTYGLSLPTLTPEMLRATVAAAHARGKLALVHIGDLAGARAAIDAGADGLAHLFVDRDPDAEFGAFVASHKAFVVPTLTVLQEHHRRSRRRVARRRSSLQRLSYAAGARDDEAAVSTRGRAAPRELPVGRSDRETTARRARSDSCRDRRRQSGHGPRRRAPSRARTAGERGTHTHRSFGRRNEHSGENLPPRRSWTNRRRHACGLAPGLR